MRATVAAGLLAAVVVGLSGTPAAGKGGPVVGSGDTFYLNDSFSGTANTVFRYGDPPDTAYAGDWNGDGRDTLLVRRGNTFFLRNTNSTGAADATFRYGDPADRVFLGDWDGNGTDTPAVRRGNAYLLRNTNSSGVADVVFRYGDAGDQVLVGDWNGDGTDTLAVRRGNRYFVRNSNTSGAADFSFVYGNGGDVALVGDWDGNGADTLAVRRGSTFLMRNALSSGAADRQVAYGNPSDAALVGDWNGNGVDTFAVRRPPALGNIGSLTGVDLERIPTSTRVVALTFDAGANAAAVRPILTTLEAQGVKGTFFLTGNFARSFPGEVAAIAASGHRLANHSDTHAHYPQLTDEQIRQDLARAENAILAAAGSPAKPLFRFPFGDRTPADIAVVNQSGYYAMRWTVDTLGWQGTSGGMTAEGVVQRVLNTLQPGQIVLMHLGSHPQDGSTLDADALPRIITELRARGYAFVTLDSLLD